MWTQYNDNLIHKFIVGWILVMSEMKGYFPSVRVKYCNSALTINRTWGLHMTESIIFSLRLSQLSYQCYHILTREFRNSTSNLVHVRHALPQLSLSADLIYIYLITFKIYTIMPLELTLYTI